MTTRARWPLFLGTVVAASTFVFAPAFPAAPIAPPDALEAWMPDDVMGVVKLNGLGDRLDTFLKSDLRKEIESLDLVRAALAQDAWQKFQEELKTFESASGKDPLQVFRDLLGQEIVAGVRLGFGPEVVFLTRAKGETELEAGLKALRDAVQARLGYLPMPVVGKYRDRAIETYDKVSMVKLGTVLVVSNSQPCLEKVIDLAAGESKASVKASPLFQKASGAFGKDCLASLAVRPQHIPNFKIPEKLDNPLGSLLASGWVGALEGSDLLSLALRVDDGSVALDVASALGSSGLAERYKSFFPEIAADGLAKRLEERGILVFAQIHRNLAQWWEKREELLVPKAAGDLLGFSQIMSIIFQGRNFQDEVLPEFGPTITLVARNQEYASLKEKPKPAIPGFAAVFELKSAESFQNGIITGFQTFVGIINADQAQKKKEMAMGMLLRTEKVGETDLHTVSLNLPPNQKPGIAANFTPSLAVVGSRVVLSSSQELAKVLIEELKALGTPKSTASGRAADALHLKADPIHGILRENFDLLVADQMLKKGIGKEEAEKQMNTLVDLLKKARDLRVDARKDGSTIRLRLELRTRLGSAGAKTTEAKKAVSL